MASDVPVARELIEAGLRFEKAGMLERALDRYRAVLEVTADPVIVSEVWRRRSHVYRTRCEWTEAVDAARESAAAARRSGRQDLLAEALNAEAAVHHSQGALAPASSLYEQMLELTTSDRIRGVALQNLGNIAALSGRYDEAREYLSEALERFDRAEYEWGRAHVLNNLGRLALDSGDTSRGGEVLRAAVKAAVETGDLDLLAVARLNYAEWLLGTGDFQDAEAEASASFGHFSMAQNAWRRVECLKVLGDIARRRGDPAGARRSYSAGLQIAESIGARIEHAELTDRIAALERDDPAREDE